MKIQTQIIMSIEEHNNLLNIVNTLKQSVNNLEQQLNIKNDIQLSKITENEMIELINNDKLTLERVKLWALFGSDLMIKGWYGKTILHSASYKGQLDIIQFILNRGVDVDTFNHINKTPLMYASCGGQIGVIIYLLEWGANINHQGNGNWSALHYACGWNKLECVKVLIDRGINIHLIGNFYNKNETALDVAKGHQEIVDYLKSVIKEQL